ncbi:polysaccharide deacetylase family protein [Phyllobacterium sp. 21LDTY02-6]|uniref:polysaccharide deacetylase family protein n=1 Tax=unclassified Phyllobacterium TaxID=2638441 RepID=UPI0020215E53|nr:MULTISPECIES: polysaccharide deacetylase family protein [unclassified Phyllobacterium]MCO4319644.1 polysaccharide deacetylase family protein [Phyllobacterium sp. 21LDTY02-6]MCX8280388.1 polysaccharide deacetylase family protein [Phyllobacterium sp. 0TCS1.6C]MCX8295163.1 polysaccharide deacetylase family protein [Phyllobacterium sp. 0TCS1.6A]
MRLAWHTGFASHARARYGGLGCIVMLHRVRPDCVSPLGVTRSLSITPDFLDTVLSSLKEEGTEFIAMDEMSERLSQGARPGAGRFVAVTLDDGYGDNLHHAQPVFQKHNVPFTIYAAPGLVEGAAVLWWEVVEQLVARSEHVRIPGGPEWRCRTMLQKRTAFHALMRHFSYVLSEVEQLPVLRQMCAEAGMICGVAAERDVMSWRELKQIAGDPLCTIGAHTVHHYNLRKLPPELVSIEMEQSADMIEDRLGKRPRHFAYPYGSVKAAGRREARLAAELGFVSAVTTRHGTIHPEHRASMFSLPRISINGRFQKLVYAQTMMSGATTPMANAGRRVIQA